MAMTKHEEALVFAAKNGNTACFEELYKLYYEKIYALAMTMLKSSADAQDALQMTFISAWQYIDRLDNPAAFSTWLQRIAINQCKSLIRRRRPDYSMDDEGEDGEVMQMESDIMLPEQYAERDDLSVRLQKIINELSDVQRETVMLFYFNEMTVEEIAVIMDCSVGTVKSRLFLARKALKTEIEEQERKTGEKFYGAVLLPFGRIFVGQVKSSMIPRATAMELFRKIASAILGAPIAPQMVQPSSQAGAGHVSEASRHAATAAAKHGARHAAASAAKATFPLWAKITAGIVAVAMVAAGGVFAWTKLSSGFGGRSADNSTEAAEGSENAYAVGDTITFGRFEQDNNTENGAEDIVWRVLENTDGKIFVISEYALDSLSYEDYGRGENWSDTGLRNYLNGEFYQTAFNEDEQRYIADTYLLCDEGHIRELSDHYVMEKGSVGPEKRRDTVANDKLFILNDFEMTRYFSSDDQAVAKATEYAIAKGVEVNQDRHTAWWLRSYTTENDICLVDEDGSVDINSGGKSGDNYALRPAMWIDLNAMEKKLDAASVVQPVDTRYLNISLNLFLKNFWFRSFQSDDFENEFDSDNLDQTNILFDMMTGWGCVNFRVYNEDLSLAFTKEKSIAQDPCPVDFINKSRAKAYFELNAEDVDDIAKKIFQCSDDDIERMRNSFPNTDYKMCAYNEGVYYVAYTRGEFIFDPCYYHPVAAEYRDGYYYFTLDLYQNRNHTRVEVNIGETTPDKRIYVKTKLLPHEGNPWWSLFYYSTTPSEEFNASPTEAPQAETLAESDLSYADLPKEYVFTSGAGGWATLLTLSDDGSYTGSFSDMDLGARTIYSCDFHGTFGTPVKVNEYLYKADILSMESDRAAGTEEKDGTTYHYSEEGRGFPKNSKTLYIYLPDTPLDTISQSVRSWLHLNSSDTSGKLGSYALSIDDKYGYCERPNQN